MRRLAGDVAVPIDAVALVRPRTALDLDEVESRVAEDEKVDLVETACRAFEEVDQLPDQKWVRVREFRLDEGDRFALVCVRRVAMEDDPVLRERHVFPPSPYDLLASTRARSAGSASSEAIR